MAYTEKTPTIESGDSHIGLEIPFYNVEIRERDRGLTCQDVRASSAEEAESIVWRRLWGTGCTILGAELSKTHPENVARGLVP